MNLFAGGPGTTSLTPEEQAELIPSLATRKELNEWERLNILEAYGWAFHPRNMKRNDILAEPFVRELHRRMFDQTWKWAGLYRSSEKNIGVEHFQIRETLAALLGDVRFWIGHHTYPADEAAVRFHHRLVWIHPFANGNGRHARLLADILVGQQGAPELTWGAGRGRRKLDFRRRYLAALREADRQDLRPLLQFARS